MASEQAKDAAWAALEALFNQTRSQLEAVGWDEDEVTKLVKEKYTSVDNLKDAQKDGLISTGLARALVDKLVKATAAAQAPAPPAGVTVQVRLIDEELGQNAEDKITLQVSEAGQKQLEGAMKRWDCWGLWDGDTRTPSGAPAIIHSVGELKDGGTYVAYGASSKGVKRLDRQLQNAGKKHELEQAIVRELSALGTAPLQARPDLHVLQSKEISIELDSVALGDKTAVIAEHEERAAVTQGNTFTIVEEVCRKAELISRVASTPALSDTKFAYFKGRQITPAVMYEYSEPKLQQALQEVCARKGVMLFGRNGNSISRVPAVKAVAALGSVRRLVQAPLVRLL